MNMQIDIFLLFEDLRKHIGNGYDELFYDAPEGDAQICIVKEILEVIHDNI